MDYLEPEYAEAFSNWKKDPTPDATANLLDLVKPSLDRGLKAHGLNDPVMRGKAKQLTIQSFKSYDPAKSKLGSHIYGNLMGLKRQSRDLNSFVHVPERILFDKRQVMEKEQELRDDLGREPSDQELMERTGISMKRLEKLRKWTGAANEGMIERTLMSSEGEMPGLIMKGDNSVGKMWVDMVYEDLQPMDQLIMEYTLGMRGKQVLSNKEIARKLNISPGAVSQRKVRIQHALDEEQDLSPFMVNE